MHSPPNFTGDIKGFNSKMFKSYPAIRQGFRTLGYRISEAGTRIPMSAIWRFQKDYNKCSDKFERWGHVVLTGRIDKPTLCALELAIRWSKKQENEKDVAGGDFWQSLCSDVNHSPLLKSEDIGTNFVEILIDGTGKLRNIYTDHALRCKVSGFERYGDVVFAIVSIPPQADLPEGRVSEISCPCIFA